MTQLLEKFSRGETTPEEEKYLFAWLETQRDEGALSLYEEYRQVLYQRQQPLKIEKSEQLLRKIHARLRAEEPAPEATRAVALWPRYLRPLVAAASVLLVALAGWWYLQPRPGTLSPTELAVAPLAMVEKVNQTTEVLPIALPDGSAIWLHPASRVRYAAALDGPQREVQLWGKAFFEVTKNPARPFVVRANELVTKVLGTSFMVEAFEHQSSYAVTVKTGTVSVTTQAHDAEASTLSTPSPVALKANQRLVFDRTRRAFTAAQLPVQVAPEVLPPTPITYTFKEVPVTDILATLSRDYGVPIRVNEQVLAGCSLTTTLTDKPFFEKLKIICEGVGPGTSFTLEDGVVVLTSLGCN
ncbi:ferric-dicitrate binding protein FerR (iron transport regulator) [Rhabdobacter roseus]|uniref:Ferric-dicitrate binding protein FerR (Iron transport regulator) n=1 Tax=Rhabdobacter roseus TaxID=1655419 RepID=A0A840U3R1_9BACT|nr:FecR family protein [Rhabdobacter roseus]MBB5286479.1 ferric-dicitrate binding protein FerR (iron transport regulator) [Rhabdobacter roseus]